MTMQQILYFQHVARLGSFTKAAQACFVSQTAVSRQISQLESEINVVLFERDTAHVRLTLAGEYFYKQINSITAMLQQSVEQTQKIAREQGAHLTLGIPNIMEQHITSDLLRQYHILYPNVQISAVSGSRRELLRQLLDYKIDLLVSLDFDLPDLSGLNCLTLKKEHSCWLLSRYHPLAAKEKIAPQEMRDETLILTRDEPNGPAEELLRQYYTQLGLRSNPSLYTNNLHELFMLTSAGVGIGLLPSSSQAWLRPDLCTVEIDGPRWNFNFLLISRKEKSRKNVQDMFELAAKLCVESE